MSGSTNFLQWNSTQANQESDSAYLADSQRTGGAPNGVDFPSTTANKLFYQVSTFIAGLANSLANKGYTVNDTSLTALEGVLANLVTFADLKSNLTSVSFSTSPLFNASSTNGFDFVLAGNVSSSTLTGQQIGQTITFVITQGSVTYSFSPPPNINGWIPINPTPNSVTVQSFIVKEDGTIQPTATEINVLLAEVAALIAANPTTVMNIVTGSRALNTAYQNTSGFKMTVAASLQLFGGVGQGVNCFGNVSVSAGSLPSSGSNSATVTANSVTNSAGQSGVTFIVPPGYWYSFTWSVDGGGSPSLSYWTEWIN